MLWNVISPSFSLSNIFHGVAEQKTSTQKSQNIFYLWAVGSRLGGDLSQVVGGVPEGRVEGGGYGPGPDSGAGVGGVARGVGEKVRSL